MKDSDGLGAIELCIIVITIVFVLLALGYLPALSR